MLALSPCKTSAAASRPQAKPAVQQWRHRPAFKPAAAAPTAVTQEHQRHAPPSAHAVPHHQQAGPVSVAALAQAAHASQALRYTNSEEEALSLLPKAIAKALLSTSVVLSILSSAFLSTASSAMSLFGAGEATSRFQQQQQQAQARQQQQQGGAAAAQAAAAAARFSAPTASAPRNSITAPSTPWVAPVATATSAASVSSFSDLELDDAVASALHAASSCWVQLHTSAQFDAFVVAANQAGYLVVTLFHAHWCAASKRSAVELERLREIHAGRRIIFAHVDCPLPGPVTLSSLRVQRVGAVATAGASSELARVHRINKTPTTRMYYGKTCLDEVVGCRPVELRQATSDMIFKFGL